MTEQELRWRAEDDARALRRAEEIKKDSTRVKEAQKVIQSELNSLSDVASTLGKKTSITKSKSTKKK